MIARIPLFIDLVGQKMFVLKDDIHKILTTLQNRLVLLIHLTMHVKQCVKMLC